MGIGSKGCFFVGWDAVRGKKMGVWTRVKVEEDAGMGRKEKKVCGQWKPMCEEMGSGRKGCCFGRWDAVCA